MIIKKGTKLKVKHQRTGTFMGVAQEDFDTDAEEFYPIAVAEGCVVGLTTDWIEGENIPCRSSFCTVEVIEN